MTPKKTSTSTAAAVTKKVQKTKAPATHPKYIDMIKDAIINLKDRNGSSRQKVKNYVRANFKVVEGPQVDLQINRAIKKGAEDGVLLQPKGPSGPVKLAKKDKPATKPAEKKEKPAAMPAPVEKKPVPVKKVSPKKKTVVKKSTTKAAKIKAPKKKSSTKKPSDKKSVPKRSPSTRTSAAPKK